MLPTDASYVSVSVSAPPQIPAKSFREMFLLQEAMPASSSSTNTNTHTKSQSAGRLIGGIFLVAGSTVGAGIVALPFRTVSDPNRRISP